MRMTSPLQAPPAASGVVVSVDGRSPCSAIVFTRPFAKNPIARPSDDQKGLDASSLSGIDRADRESSGRTHRDGGRPAADATNAICRPSGESAKCGAPEEANGVSARPGGATIVSVIGGVLEERTEVCENITVTAAAAAETTAAAVAQMAVRQRIRASRGGPLPVDV